MPSLSGVWSWIKQWRATRDEEKYQQWCAFIQTRESGAEIFQITRIRQRARTGLKAYARWLDTGEICAVWIQKPMPQPQRRVFVSAVGGCGHGRHHNEEVFYVDEVVALSHRKYYAAMRRHLARVQHSAPK